MGQIKFNKVEECEWMKILPVKIRLVQPKGSSPTDSLLMFTEILYLRTFRPCLPPFVNVLHKMHDARHSYNATLGWAIRCFFFPARIGGNAVKTVSDLRAPNGRPRFAFTSFAAYVCFLMRPFIRANERARLSWGITSFSSFRVFVEKVDEKNS